MSIRVPASPPGGDDDFVGYKAYWLLVLEFIREELLLNEEMENREYLVDTALYCYNIAYWEVYKCGRHGETLKSLNGFRDHAITCVGLDVASFDKDRVALDRMIDRKN